MGNMMNENENQFVCDVLKTWLWLWLCANVSIQRHRQIYINNAVVFFLE